MKKVVLSILGLNILFYIAEVLNPELVSSLALYPPRLLAAPWILITSMFLHAGIEHLLYNMFALVLFGMILESLVGERRFLVIYMTAGILAGLASAVAYPISYSLGASGAIYGIIGALAVLRPSMMIYIGAPLPMLLYAFVYAFLDIVGVITGINPDNIAYAAHLSGLVVGILFALKWKPDYDEKKLAEIEVSKEISDDELDEWEEKYMRS